VEASKLCRRHWHKCEVGQVTFNQVVEAVAAADASPAWCLAQTAASSHAAGFLDPKVAREVFGAPDALIAWGPPAGVAKANRR
jgi:indole-3-acetate monooxygenase